MQIDVPASSLAIQSLIEGSLGSIEHGWEVGWSLASYSNGPQSSVDVVQSKVSLGTRFFVFLYSSCFNFILFFICRNFFVL